MIGLIFEFGPETIEVRIKDSTCFFRTSNFQQFATIEGIKLDKGGVFKEFPELRDDKDWKKKAIIKFKDKIKNMKTEKEQAQYVIDDLTKFGYKPMYLQKQGFRPVKLY